MAYPPPLTFNRQHFLPHQIVTGMPRRRSGRPSGRSRCRRIRLASCPRQRSAGSVTAEHGLELHQPSFVRADDSAGLREDKYATVNACATAVNLRAYRCAPTPGAMPMCVTIVEGAARGPPDTAARCRRTRRQAAQPVSSGSTRPLRFRYARIYRYVLPPARIKNEAPSASTDDDPAPAASPAGTRETAMLNDLSLGRAR